MDTLSPHDYIPQELPFREKYSIYALIDPRNNAIRYIGMSKQPEFRLQQHMKRRHGSNYDWIQEVLGERLYPTLKIIETVKNEQQAKQRELYWIRFYAHSSYLVNKHPHHKRRSIRDVRTKIEQDFTIS